MTLLHMKYAVEIAETNSINKAAERLYVGQSTLSRAIKELEASLGTTLFERSAKGMVLTQDGEVFIRYAKRVLEQVDELENTFGGGRQHKMKFSISVPRASYIAEAFAQFSGKLPRDGAAEVFYKETNSMRAIRNILQEDYRLGIIRYAQNYDGYYRVMMEEKGLEYRTITEFRYSLLLNEKSPLAQKEKISREDLRDCMEIAYADPYVPFLPFAEVKKEELPDNSGRRIFIFERASQLELLSRNTDAYMWVSPIPEELLRRYGLIQVPCDANRRIYKDVLIYRKNYVFSELDQIFLEELEKAKQTIFH